MISRHIQIEGIIIMAVAIALVTPTSWDTFSTFTANCRPIYDIGPNSMSESTRQWREIDCAVSSGIAPFIIAAIAVFVAVGLLRRKPPASGFMITMAIAFTLLAIRSSVHVVQSWKDLVLIVIYFGPPIAYFVWFIKRYRRFLRILSSEVRT